MDYSKFEIINMYSGTDEPDERGRWARKVIYKGFLIGWITKFQSIKKEVKFDAICYFPQILILLKSRTISA